jgi:hypothetical protein
MSCFVQEYPNWFSILKCLGKDECQLFKKLGPTSSVSGGVMSAHDWALYIQMQLVPLHPDASESVPILQPDDGGDSENECEVKNTGGDESRININGAESILAVPHEITIQERISRESQDGEIEERGSEESLVQDQPQCRICLDTGGNLISLFVYFFYGIQRS